MIHAKQVNICFDGHERFMVFIDPELPLLLWSHRFFSGMPPIL